MTKHDFLNMNFRPFDNFDFELFSGVTSACPMIYESDEEIVVIDGDFYQVFTASFVEEFAPPSYDLAESGRIADLK